MRVSLAGMFTFDVDFSDFIVVVVVFGFFFSLEKSVVSERVLFSFRWEAVLRRVIFGASSFFF